MTLGLVGCHCLFPSRAFSLAVPESRRAELAGNFCPALGVQSSQPVAGLTVGERLPSVFGGHGLSRCGLLALE